MEPLEKRAGESSRQIYQRKPICLGSNCMVRPLPNRLPCGQPMSNALEGSLISS